MFDVTVPLWLLVLTHLVVAAVAFTAGRALVLRLGEALAPTTKEQVMPDGPSKPTIRATIADNKVALVLILASCFIIAIGVQAYLGQREQDQQDRRDADQQACLTRWGNDLTDAITARVTPVRKLDRANAARNDALDDLVGTIILLRVVPPRATDADLTRVLARYSRAAARYRTAQEDVREARAANPYPKPPVLTCGTAAPKE